MLLFLLSFYLHYDLLNSEEIKIAKFNESLLVDKHHQNLREAKSLLRDLHQEQRFKETTVLGVDKRDEELISHDSSTNLLRSRKERDDRKHQITKDRKKPPAVFLRYPQNDPYDRRQGLSPFAGLHEPPLIIESPYPEPIPPGHLLSLKNSFFPDLVVPQSLFSVNGPGRYLESSSYSPSFTRKTSKRPSVRAQSPSPDPIPPGHLLSPRDSFFPHLMVPQELLSVNGPGRYIASFSDSPSSIRTKPKRSSVIALSPSPKPIPPVTLKKPELKSGLAYPGHRLNPKNSIYPEPVVPQDLLSVYGPGRFRSSVSYSPSSTKTTSKRPQVLYKEAPLRVHFYDENPHELKTVSSAITPSISNRVPSSRFRPRLTTPSRTIDVNPKTWLGEIAYKILKVSNEHTASSQSRGTSTVPAPPRMFQAKQYTLSTGTANRPKAQLFTEDENGFLYVTLAETTSEDPNKQSKPTIAGDVLHGKIQVPVLITLSSKRIAYNDEMEQLDEGYLMFFFIKMCRLISEKSRSEMRLAMRHMEMIYKKRWESGQFEWVEEPLETVIRNMLMVPPEKYGIGATQTRAAMMSRMLLERRQVLSPEVNSIIDHAEMFFMDEDGERLLHYLEEFEDYPNTTKTSYQICDALMENLLLPFQRASSSPRRQQFVDTINKALQERFPYFLKGGTAGEKPIENQPRKRKRNQTKRGALKQMPRDQPRFRAVTTERYRAMNTRPTPTFLPRDYELRTHRVLRERYQKKQMNEVF